MVCSYEGSRQEEFMRCQAASFSGSCAAHTVWGAHAAFSEGIWCLAAPGQSDNVWLFLFLVHQQSAHKQTGHCVPLCNMLTWQQYCIQSFLEHRWAINWFWRKQKWKWGHSQTLLTQEHSYDFERLLRFCDTATIWDILLYNNVISATQHLLFKWPQLSCWGQRCWTVTVTSSHLQHWAISLACKKA